MQDEAHERGMSRREFLGLGAAGAGAVLLGGCGAASGGAGKTLKVGNIGWDEDVAVANLTKILLQEHLGYGEVTLKTLEAGALFQGVAGGDLDTFQDVWLPKTHASYWKKFGDEVTRLPSWYEGAGTLGLAVPDYVEAKSIADLNEYKSRFGGRITGIESGAGEMSIVQNKVIPAYGLNYKLVASSTPAMLAALKKAISAKKPIVVTLWKPHWAFTAFPIRYLEDPKDAFGKPDHIYTIVRKGLKKDQPEAYALLDAMKLSPEQLGKLELSIRKHGQNTPTKGVRAWLKDNRRVVDPWIKAAKKAGKGS
ncbi:glycine betaine ABC transporter substrate-binding protein [Rubrobacter naiadicus]|uniref:glycine betaine ABC transporter substrate-binding protein n=1 Tax=Rubrobacter naiadicus TaxID=1392641 RepID=UPI00236211A1|nr:glycine betaine ABC transporter substrate-binding protein [Rubrobacter naiadicus]